MKKAPKDGYILEKWGLVGYRATAMAYMVRENLTEVKHQNGELYTKEEIKNSIIN